MLPILNRHAHLAWIICLLIDTFAVVNLSDLNIFWTVSSHARQRQLQLDAMLFLPSICVWQSQLIAVFETVL